MNARIFQPGTLVQARGREWVVLPHQDDEVLHLRPLGGGADDISAIYLPLETHPPEPAVFALPDPAKAGNQAAALLLRDALRLKLRAGAGPFRSFGNLGFEPRAYQFVPLMMALQQECIRLLITDDVGIGKTIEAGLIVRELLDRGEIERMSVLCPPHLCDQWQNELATKFNIQTEIVRSGTAGRLERELPVNQSIFDFYPFTVISLDYIKSDRRRDEFLHQCPEFVIVEEAHTCVQGRSPARHQRARLLQGLAAEAERHMVLLTATPHNGDEDAFYNLLGVLDPKYSQIREAQPVLRRRLREQLASQFVQRRRPDIAEWKDATVFPDRQTRETTYTLTGAWGRLFNEILVYARGMVLKAEGKGILQQRMSWWSALALLRCASSSPAAATNALRTRLRKAETISDERQVADLDQQAADAVLDGTGDDFLSLDETEPAGRMAEGVEEEEDADFLDALIERAEALRGPTNDPKLTHLIRELKDMVNSGFSPVVFCRFIATVHYVAHNLQKAFAKRGYTVAAVTGELVSEERQEKVKHLKEHNRRILVTTDCLSEGINLQSLFDAVVHYDLSWNPARHEQREGRVDRFGQPAVVVRALMLYGENNPVDGAVLHVILRKAERIRRELGITVPIPEDPAKVIQAVMEAVLLRGGDSSASVQKQLALDLDLGPVESQFEKVWQSAQAKARQSRTIFAQRRLRPDDVLPEWRKAVAMLGNEGSVEGLVRIAVQRLGAPLGQEGNFYRLPVKHLPLPLKERLEAVGIDPQRTLRISFTPGSPGNVEYIHRTHPLVSTLAEYVAERALAEEQTDLAARAGAIFTKEVRTRTVIYLLRLRIQIAVQQPSREHFLIAEECLVAAHKGSDLEILEEMEEHRMLTLVPARNMHPTQRCRLLQSTIDNLPAQEDAFAEIARQRAAELLADHRRVRTASEGKGIRYSVAPCLPMDVIGIYVLVPAVEW